MLQFFVADDSALFQINQEHTARLQPSLELDLGGRHIQDAGLRSHHQFVVVGDQVPEGAQAVAVQEGADAAAVGGHDHGRTVPWLHQGGVVLVEVLLLLGHGLMLVPGLGYQHQQGMVQVAARHLEQLQGVVQAGGVAIAGVHNRSDLGHVVPEQRRLEMGLPGVHPVKVAPEGVDLAVVGQIAVGMGQPPTAQGVGAEPGVDQCEGAGQVLILQVLIEPGYLVGHEQALVDDGVAGHAADVEAVGFLFGQSRITHRMLDDLADHV